MQRVLFVLFCFLFAPIASFAETYIFRQAVYTVGVDIPEGPYIVSSSEKNIGFAAIRIYGDDKDSLYFTVMHPSNTYFGHENIPAEYRIYLKNGMSVDVAAETAVFQSYEGATLFTRDIKSQLEKLSREDLLIVGQELDRALNKFEQSSETQSTKAKENHKYEKLNYERAARMPELCIDQKVEFSGKVVQVMGSRSEGYNIRLATKDGYDDVIYVFVSKENTPSVNILEGDKITIKGTLTGDYTYESIWGQQITIPSASADSVSISLSSTHTTILSYDDGTQDKFVNGVLVENDGTVATVKKSVNIRAEATADSKKVGSANPGDKFTVTQENYVPGWHQILYNGQTCYVSAKYVTVK